MASTISLVFAFIAAKEIRGYRKNETEKALLLITIIVVVIEKEKHKKMWKNLEKIRKREFSDLAENYYIYYSGINKETTERVHL